VGDKALLDLNMPVVSLRSGETIRFAVAPAERAPSLPLAYRASDLITTVVQDAHPVSDDEVATVYVIAASTMAMSCSVVPPLTPTPAITWSSLVSGTPPPIAEYLPPETARRG
jgi:hypothetical protein